MNLLSRLLPLDHVLLDLEASSKKRLFEQIGLLFENSRQIPRARGFDSLCARSCAPAARSRSRRPTDSP
jgi:PTS system nitrogen regulatory IIA component